MSTSDRPTEHLTTKVFTDHLTKLRGEATLHGLNETDAINQAIHLWAELASKGLVGQKFSIMLVGKPVPLPFWKQFLNKLARKRLHEVTKISITLPGDSPDVQIDKALRRIREQDD